jgi:hypothetical protein
MRSSKHYYLAVFDSDAESFGGAVNDGSGYGFVLARHKRNHRLSPFCIVNEVISSAIGNFLNLPVPPYAITRAKNRRVYFSSLNFNFAMEELPPVMPEQLWKHLPMLATGVVLFDILIANNDRHDKNLVVDHLHGPRDLKVFDHDQSLLGGGFPVKGIRRLNTAMNRLVINGGPPLSGARHCLLDVIDSPEHFGVWCHRIETIPGWFLDETCNYLAVSGFTKKKIAKRIASFLKHRRTIFRDILKAHRSEFTAIKDWNESGWLL